MNKEFFENRYKSIGGNAKSIMLKKSLRVNTLMADDEEVVQLLKEKGVILKKIPQVEHAYFYFSDFSLGSTPEYLEGLFYIQDFSSMLPAIILNPKKKDKILDMCAAPGSKTTQMAAMMNNQGSIVAVEKSKSRLNALKLNLMRGGVTNTLVYHKNVLNFKSEEKFDKILLDAPCSGNYTQEKDWFEKRTLAGIIKNALNQKKLVRKAHSLLKVGGTLVYSTCSLEPEEDELIVDYALKLGFRIEKINLSIGSSGATSFNGLKFNDKVKFSVRLWPFKNRTQGFFLAKLIKEAQK